MHIGLYVIILSGALSNIAAFPEEESCKTSKKCTDVYRSMGKCVYSCLEQIIVASSVTKIEIECYQTRKLSSDLLPDVSFAKAKEMYISSCPLPTQGFQEIASSFNITQLKYLNFLWKGNEQKNLTKESFTGLLHLNELILMSNKLTRIEENAFDEMPELTNLNLNENNLLLTRNLFKNLSKLQTLNIEENGLESVYNIFPDSLRMLENLYLKGNKIDSIDRSALENLINLKVLDLSYNFIRFIDLHAFTHLSNLVEIRLERNNFVNLSRRFFKNNTRLQRITLHNIANLTLINGVFSNFANLNTVNLGSSQIKILPENLFENSISLKKIIARRCSLQKLAKNLFYGLRKLKNLFLNNNDLEELHEDIFESLSSLKILSLHNNKLKILHKDLLRNLVNLEELNLSWNRILAVDISSSFPLKKLQGSDLSGNKIESLEVNHLLSDRREYKLKIHLEHNEITYLNFSNVEDELLKKPHVKRTFIFISHNPIKCDCQIQNILKYNTKYSKISSSLQIDIKELYCEDDGQEKVSSITNETLNSLTCPIENSAYNCSAGNLCRLSWKASSKTVIVNCSNSGISEIPKVSLRHGFDYNQTQFYLDGNLIKRGPEEDEFGKLNVTELYLHDNQIENITWIPSNIRILTLHNNRIKYLNYDILKKLETSILEKMTLHGNPLNCGCSAKNFVVLINHKYWINSTDVRCAGSNKLVSDLDENNLCLRLDKLMLKYLHIFPVFFVVVALCAIFYYKYQTGIKIWLWARGYCLCWIKYEDDKKVYDAFISYSPEDIEIVTKYLIPKLESGPTPFKLCVDYINFLGGEEETNLIIKSVEESRKTLVVLSPSSSKNYLTRIAATTAHTMALAEGRSRLIVILYGKFEVDSLLMNDVFRSYLLTNTYIKWDDPLFWERLTEALSCPKSRKLKLAQRKTRNNKDRILAVPEFHNESYTPIPQTECAW